MLLKCAKGNKQAGRNKDPVHSGEVKNITSNPHRKRVNSYFLVFNIKLGLFIINFFVNIGIVQGTIMGPTLFKNICRRQYRKFKITG